MLPQGVHNGQNQKGGTMMLRKLLVLFAATTLFAFALADSSDKNGAVPISEPTVIVEGR